MENYISEIDILDESKDCFLTYASEVLTDRAIPSAEDGMLSAQRKLAWTMEDYLKMDASGKTKKCNAIVGSTLATSYFHGDISCYGVLCKMSQPYLMRYPLIIGQGSLGTQENNDMVASSRYTEAKPSKFMDLMMTDFKKGVVPLKETYNGEFMEPVVLPGTFPNALCNGRQAIGISMSHNSLPHNLTEVCDAIIAYISKGNLTIDELMEYIKGPDFPLKNVVINKDAIKAAFATGKSNVSLKVRGVYEVKGRDVIFTSIPYRTYRNKIKEQITKNIEELETVIDDFNDNSGLGENKLVFHLKPNVTPEVAVSKLFALTDLQTTLSYNMNYIVNGTPKLCSMVDLIKAYVSHQTNVLLAATAYDREKAAARKHVLEGLVIALKDIDKAIELIKTSDDRASAKKALVDYFKITEIQADAILDMKLAKLTKLDKDDLLKELEEKKNIIAECDKIAGDEVYRNSKLIAIVEDMKAKYGDARRTELIQIDEPKDKAIKEIAEVVPEDVVVITTQSGLIKRVPVASFKTGNRNTKGVKTKDDIVLDAVKTNTVDAMMFFTNTGKMYRTIVDKIPVGTNATRGTAISDLVKLEKNEKVIAVTSLHRKTTPKYIIFITKNGILKKSLLEEYTKTNRNTGIQALSVTEGDEVVDVLFQDDEELIIVTKKGISIRFETKDISTLGRVARGVKAIKLKEGDEVITGLSVHKTTDQLAIFAAGGLAKKSPLSEYPVQGRYGVGLAAYKVTPESGEVAAALLISDDDNLLISSLNTSLVISAKDVPLLGRTAAGNLMIKSNRIVSVTKI